MELRASAIVKRLAEDRPRMVAELGPYERNAVDTWQEALLAVLEIHEKQYGLCGACGEVVGVAWPCPTVLAIAKAIGVETS